MRYSRIARTAIIAAFLMLLPGCSDPTQPDYKPPECSGGPERCLVFAPGWSYGARIPVPSDLPTGYAGLSDLSVVRLPDGRYRVFGMADEPQAPGEPYSNVRIYYSFISSDGVHFTYEPGVRRSAFGAHIGHVSVMQDGSCRMYYGYNVGGGVPQTEIRSAWSPDCFTFTVEPGARLTATSGIGDDGTEIFSGEVVTTPGGGYRMYYAGSRPGGTGILSATSTDGLNWTREPGVRLVIEELCAVAPAGGMVRAGYDGTVLRGVMFAQRCEVTGPGRMRNLRTGIWELTSSDGLNFQVSGTPAVTGYVNADRFILDGKTHPFVGGVDPAAVVTPNGMVVVFSIYGGPGDDAVTFPESGHYVMVRRR